MAIYQDAIKEFYSVICRYLQFDDTNWAFLADATKQQQLKDKGIDPQEIARACTDIINNALTDKPKDIIITTHICRGNHASSWLFSGGYEPVAKELFVTNGDGFFLEYDNDRSGDFEPLRYWSGPTTTTVKLCWVDYIQVSRIRKCVILPGKYGKRSSYEIVNSTFEICVFFVVLCLEFIKF